MARRAGPNLIGVLAATVPGRVVRLTLTPRQTQDFRDPDGRVALNVVRHLLGARTASTKGDPPDSFPLTEATFQAVAARLGATVGIKRCRPLIRRLEAGEIVARSGSYRQRYTTQGSSGYRVRLYRLLVGAGRAAPRKRAVGRRAGVKSPRRARWWAHPLFGDPNGLPPPHLPLAQLRRMRSSANVCGSEEEGCPEKGRCDNVLDAAAPLQTA